MRSPFWSTSSDPLIETPPPSTTMSSKRIDCGFCTTVKVAFCDLPDVLTQPGRMLSSFSAVRSASMPRRLSCSPILPISLIGSWPDIAGPRSIPSRARLATTKPGAGPATGIALGRFAIIELRLLSVDLDVAPDLIAGIVGDDLQRVGLQLLVHHQLVGG